MKHLFLITFFLYLTTASFAQRFGVDVGYGYSINQFKDIPGEDPRTTWVQSDLKQKIAPNVSLRPYFKIYRTLYFQTGADLSRYVFRHSVYFNDMPVYNYSYRMVVSEVRIPALIRMDIVKFRKKHALSIFGGMFARISVWGKEAILWGGGGYNSIPDQNFNSDVSILDKKQRYMNFTAGIHQSFLLTRHLAAFAGIRFAYMPGYWYQGGYGILRLEPMHIEDKYSFTFSLGISIFKPNKEKTPNIDLAHPQD